MKTLTHKLIFIITIGCFLVSCTDRNHKSSEGKKDTLTTLASAAQISSAIEKDPANAELYYQRSIQYLNEKYLDRSLDDINEAIRLQEANPLYYYQKGRILYAMNRTMDAAKAYESAITLKPDYNEAKMKLAELYYIVKEHRKSIDLLNSLVQTGLQPQAYFFKGMNLKEMGDTGKAIAAFQLAIENDNTMYDAYMQLGLIYTAKQNKAAYEYYTSAIRLRPRSEEAYFGRAYYLQQMNRFQDALFDYRKVVDINPSNDKAYYNVGIINYDAKKYDEALRSWNICIQMNNNNVDAYYMRGLVHERKGNKKEARMNYEYVLQLDPDYTLAKERLNQLK